MHLMCTILEMHFNVLIFNILSRKFFIYGDEQLLIGSFGAKNNDFLFHIVPQSC